MGCFCSSKLCVRICLWHPLRSQSLASLRSATPDCCASYWPSELLRTNIFTPCFDIHNLQATLEPACWISPTSRVVNTKVERHRFIQIKNQSYIDSKTTAIAVSPFIHSYIPCFTLNGQKSTRHPGNTLYLLTSVVSFAVDNDVRANWSDWSLFYDLFVLFTGKKAKTKSVFNVPLTSEVAEGQITLLEMVWVRLALLFVSCVPENHEKRVFTQN